MYQEIYITDQLCQKLTHKHGVWGCKKEKRANKLLLINMH